MTLPAVYQCPAKVNLTLSVGPPRESDGMHPICSWMVRVSLHDDLTIIPRASRDSAYDIAFADDAPQPSPIDWPIDADLAVRAHRLVEQHVGRALPVQVIVRKHIPVGAGLAGGSSNAATMMIALNETFDLGLSVDTLAELAGRLGSDITFFFGPPSAVISGVGDRIDPAPLENTLYLAVITPPLACNTGSVYSAFDRLRPDGVVIATGAGDAPFNDLAVAAFDVEPRLLTVRDQCAELTGCDVHVTGSGAAMFIVCDTERDAVRIASQITESLSIPARAVHTL